MITRAPMIKIIWINIRLITTGEVAQVAEFPIKFYMRSIKKKSTDFLVTNVTYKESL